MIAEIIYCKESYESLIRKLLSSPSKPAVIEIFMTMENGVNYHDCEIEIGKKYDVAMISFTNEAKEIIDNNKLPWSVLLTDEVHPNDEGHKIIGDLLTDFIEKVYEEDYKAGEKADINYNVLETPCVFGERQVTILGILVS